MTLHTLVPLTCVIHPLVWRLPARAASPSPTHTKIHQIYNSNSGSLPPAEGRGSRVSLLPQVVSQGSSLHPCALAASQTANRLITINNDRTSDLCQAVQSLKWGDIQLHLIKVPRKASDIRPHLFRFSAAAMEEVIVLGITWRCWFYVNHSVSTE